MKQWWKKMNQTPFMHSYTLEEARQTAIAYFWYYLTWVATTATILSRYTEGQPYNKGIAVGFFMGLTIVFQIQGLRYLAKSLKLRKAWKKTQAKLELEE